MENNKAVEAASNSVGGATTGQGVNGNGGAGPDPSTIPNPKLGMAPLSSEIAVAASSNNVPGESSQPPNPPLPDPLQHTDPPNTHISVPPMVDAPRSDLATAGPTQIPAIPVPSKPEQGSQANVPQPSSPDPATLQPDPSPTADLPEQVHPPNPDPIPLGPLPVDPPADVDSRPSQTDNAPEERS